MRALTLLVFVAVFFVSYQFAGQYRGDPAFWTTRFPLLLVGVFVVFFSFLMWKSLRGRSDYFAGCSLLNQGRLVDAVDAFTRAATKSPRNAGFEYQRAVGLMHLLRLEEAHQSFVRAQALSQPAGCRDLFAASAQLVLALQGKQALTVGEAASADLVLARAVELARKAEWQAALEQLEHPSQQMLWGTTRVLKEALAAWGHAELGKEKRSVELSLLRQPGVADVATFWPQLAEYLKSSS